jgi:4-hydroxy-tetrahydrodipicolinate synthase
VQLLAPLRPFAGPPTHADLIAYFEAIARESKLPITLYLNPGPGADVTIADTIALAKLPSVKLIKEMNAPPCCSSSSRCSRRNGCTAGSPPS